MASTNKERHPDFAEFQREAAVMAARCADTTELLSYLQDMKPADLPATGALDLRLEEVGPEPTEWRRWRQFIDQLLMECVDASKGLDENGRNSYNLGYSVEMNVVTFYENTARLLLDWGADALDCDITQLTQSLHTGLRKMLVESARKQIPDKSNEPPRKRSKKTKKASI